VAERPHPRWALAPNPSAMTLEGTRTYVVGRATPVVIDPGPDHPLHRESILSLLAGATPLAIVLTHAHSDHSEGAGALRRATGAPVWLAATSTPDPAIPVDRVAEQGTTFETDEGRLEVLGTPGHTPDHVSLLWTGGAAPGGAGIFVGDLFMGQGDTTLVAPPEGDLSEYLRSLDLIAATGAAWLYPAHGDPLSDAAATAERFRRHREVRIDQVRRALESDPAADPDRLLDLVYGPALDPRLRAAAAGSLQAILFHIRRIG
jgi:glyoxylase-like metal-dependent hydrolase (beta-lactamase superfamily II)